MVNLTTINKELEKQQDFCLIALKGKVKGETLERDHLFPCIHCTYRLMQYMGEEVGQPLHLRKAKFYLWQP